MSERWTEHERLVEQQLSGWLGEDRRPADRDAQLADILGQIHEAPGTRRRFPGWLQRDALARRRNGNHDIAFDTHPGRNRIMFSATGLVAIFAVLALAVNVITTSDEPPAADGATLSVATDGSGDYATIGEAIAAAADGDTILVGPGTYTEALLLDKSVTIQGHGPREDIVITAYSDPASWPTSEDKACQTAGAHRGCAALIVDASPSLSNLTFRGDFAGVFAFGGAPVLERLTFSAVGRILLSGDERGGETLAVLDGSRLTLRDSELVNSRGIWIDGGAAPVIERNSLNGGSAVMSKHAGDEAVLRGNRIAGAAVTALTISGPTRMLVEGNVIIGSEGYAIHVGGSRGGPDVGVDPIVRGNTFEGNAQGGIIVEAGPNPTVEGNDFIDNPIGIQVGQATGSITGNSIRDGKTGIVVVSGGSPTIEGNVIDVTGRGIVAGKGTSPVITGNDVCGGDMSIYVSEDATADLGANQTCEGDVTG